MRWTFSKAEGSPSLGEAAGEDAGLEDGGAVCASKPPSNSRRSARRQERILLSSGPTLAGFVVLVFDFLSGPGFEGREGGANRRFAEFENCGMLFFLHIGPPDRQVVFTFLGEQQPRTDGQGEAEPATRLLPVLNIVDQGVGDFKFAVLVVEDKGFFIFGGRPAFRSILNLVLSAADVGGLVASNAGKNQRFKIKHTHQHQA